MAQSQPIQGAGTQKYVVKGSQIPHKDSVDDFGGYQNPYSATIDIEKEKRKQQELEIIEEKKKTYSIEFMMSLKEQFKQRPANMALLILPHKKRRVMVKQEESEANEKEQQFQAQIGKLRTLLNKISKDNFDRV
jgi:hypothetical protein